MDRTAFFTALRARSSGLFGTSLSAGQLAMLNLILDEGQARDVPLKQLAYVLATPYHEVGRPMQPVSENLNYSTKAMMKSWPSRFPTAASTLPYVKQPKKLANFVYGGRMGNTGPNDGWDNRGRGLSQITGKGMYARIGGLIGVDLVANPDLALRPDIAVKILFTGMLRGIFTGKKLADFISGTKANYTVARAIINDDVKRNGATVAGYARSFEACLVAGGYAGHEAPAQATAPAKPPLALVRNSEPPKPAAPVEPAPVAVDAAPVVPDPPTKEVIETVQKRLADLGYNPGGIDGKMGPLTRGAILSFKNDAEGLTPSDTIDEDFLTALATASPRKMAPDRAHATVGEVAAKIPEARVHWWTRLGAAVVGGGTAVTKGVDYIAPATTYLTPFKDFVGEVPQYVWIGGVIFVCVALYLGSQYGVNKSKEAFNSGDRR